MAGTATAACWGWPAARSRAAAGTGRRPRLADCWAPAAGAGGDAAPGAGDGAAGTARPTRTGAAGGAGGADPGVGSRPAPGWPAPECSQRGARRGPEIRSRSGQFLKCF